MVPTHRIQKPCQKLTVQLEHQTHVPQSILIQAARILDKILIVVLRDLSLMGYIKAEVQQRVLQVPSQVTYETTITSSKTTTVELRTMGLETLNPTLQSSGHTLVVDWEIIRSSGYVQVCDSINFLITRPP